MASEEKQFMSKMSDQKLNSPSTTSPAGELVPPTRVSGAQGVVASLTRRRFIAATSSLFGAGVLGSLSGCGESTSATPAGSEIGRAHV